MTVAERLAQHVAETRFETLPPAAVDAAKTFLLDTLGVATAGSGTPGSDAVRAAAEGWGSGTEARVLGTALRLPAPAAAFVNAHHAHCQEFDCLHEPAVVHALSTVMPAALAWAERMGGITGRDFLTALALGVDVAVTLGLNPRGRWQFFRPGTAGAFGAVAAVGKLAGFNAARLADAFGLAYAQVSGTMQPHGEGKPLLPLQIGFSARNAVVAADLARADLAGTRETFEGKHGYIALFEPGFDLAPALAELGCVWRIAELSHKPFPSGRATHGLIDGLLRLKAAHGFAAEEVEQVLLLASPLIAQLVGRPPLAEMSASYARLCARYVGAVALLRGGVGLDDFGPEAMRDPAARSLAAKIVIAIDEQARGNVLLPQELAIRLKNGTVHRLHIADTLGSPDRPLDRERQLAKFRVCWAKSAARLPAEAADRVIAAVERIETLEDVRALARLAAP